VSSGIHLTFCLSFSIVWFSLSRIVLYYHVMVLANSCVFRNVEFDLSLNYHVYHLGWSDCWCSTQIFM